MKATIGLIVIVVLIAFGARVFFPVDSDSEPANEDIVVVACAEAILGDYATLVDRDIIYELGAEGIVLGKDEDPFGEHEDYIGFKATFYREFFQWGILPPYDIMEKAGITEE